MDHIAPRERDFDIDLEVGWTVSEEDSSKDSGFRKQGKTLITKICKFADGTVKDEERISSPTIVSNTNKICADNVKSEGEGTPTSADKEVVREKRKKTSNKKSLKPPRPPKGPSLDAADQKLIREITELATLKRARIERMKALKKMKAAKTSSSNGNFLAMVFTILFCLVIIFQGMSSRGPSANLQGSPMSAGAADGGLISVQYFGNPSASGPNGHGAGSPNLVEQVAGSDTPEKLQRVAALL
ncbi:hypothetical protein HS088_TW01G00025 [Tripterygium wilfordii]|uniref:Transmembrane protein n=1 Tax=Tripterygium wilfordii TaxID=458696 RepID=A0A7J7E0J0_TRIWF|nr:uncharacterized protein LOC120013456 isoform X1 [Tripterygium wilfordii]XP_038721301.1 uncharacterized protein LOC120013456 isoform X1 [Tripterygium wilfordii]KAF5752118.1 hypothetical protein HS088_TW01G00025 [Tripterygium wilfordii]